MILKSRCKKYFFLFSLIFPCWLFGQTMVFGINVDKSYPELIGQKEIKLKDQSIFYSVIIRVGGNEFDFSTVKENFPSFKNPRKYYEKGLIYLKKIFGEPINIYQDSSYKKKSTDFFIWKIKRDKGYFFVFYCTSFVLTLNIEKMYDEASINEHIRNTIESFYAYNGRNNIIKTSELNMKDDF